MLEISNKNFLSIYDGAQISVWEKRSHEYKFKFSIEHHPIAMAISHSAHLLVLSGSDKLLRGFDMKNGQELWKKNVNKRLCKIQFTKKDDFIVVSDRSGDVFKFSSVESEEDKGELLLGHVSLMTDMILANDDQFVITADRDEKVRVTKYPKTYIIERFLLGHSDFVSSILVPSFCPDFLLSAGGDQQILVWNWKTGDEIAQISLPIEESESPLYVSKLMQAVNNQTIIILLEGISTIFLLSFANNEFGSTVSKVSLPDIPVDAVVDEDDNQVVFQFYKQTPSIVAFEFTKDGTLLQPSKSVNLDSLKDVVKAPKSKIEEVQMFRCKLELQKKSGFDEDADPRQTKKAKKMAVDEE